MSAAREEVLARIRAALGPASAAPTAAGQPGFRRRSEGDEVARIETFASRAAGYKVKVARSSRAAASQAVAGLLAARGHSRIAVPADLPDALRPEGFEFLPDEALDRGAIAGTDGVLTTCACAIAETGTLVLDHGEGQGRRLLTLLPDYHLCVVPSDRIVGLVPEAVTRMAPAVRAGRPLTFISGPSATSDIELNRVEGVHGPRTLDILILEA